MITHQGIIEDIKPQTIIVKIEATSACAACHAQKACGMDELQEKLIEIPIDNSFPYHKGDIVEIEMTTSTGFKAVFFAYLAPFIIMSIVFVILYFIKVNEGVIAICSLLSILLYYWILSFFKHFLKKQIQFSLKI